MCVYLELAAATVVDVDAAAAVQEHDVVVVAVEAALADKHEPALGSDSHRASESDCIEDKHACSC